MEITPLAINGAFLLEMEEMKDMRGSFARQFCKKELATVGIDFEIKQCNVSKNTNIGVLRGLHYQQAPYPEVKMVSCLMGKIYDVLADIRPESPTYLKWVAIELSEANGKMLYVPPGIAHGFQTLEANCLVYYQLGEFFKPDYYGGVCWDDPKFNIKWPDYVQRTMNERDANYELLK